MKASTTLFYVSCFIYLYHIIRSDNTDMLNYSFNATVILGIIALLNRR